MSPPRRGNGRCRLPAFGVASAPVARPIAVCYLLATLAVAAPLLAVAYAPLEDGPEHLFQAQLVRGLGADDPVLTANYQLNPAPRTALLTTAFFGLLLEVFAPPRALSVGAFLLVLGLLAATWFVASAAGPPSAAISFAPVLALDVCFYKGFLNFSGGVVFALLALGCQLRLLAPDPRDPRDGRPRRRLAWASGLGASAALCLLAHPYAYAVLGLVVLLVLAQRLAPGDPPARARVPTSILASVIALAPSGLVALWVLAGLSPGEGPMQVTYLFPLGAKARAFFHEGWRTLGPWQPWPQLAAIITLVALWYLRAGRTHRRPPLLPLLFALLYLALPEEMTAWSWISIRMPLLFALALVVLVSQAPLPPRLVGPTAAAALALTAVNLAFTVPVYRQVSDTLAAYAEAASHLPPGARVLSLLPLAAPPGGRRAHLVGHAPAYLGLAVGAAYPEVFAKDPRHHWVSVRPEVQPALFDFERSLPWQASVDPAVRLRWFAAHGEVAVALDQPPELLEALGEASAETIAVNPRVQVFLRGP